MGAPAAVIWHVSHRYDLRALPLANRHYNRRRPETPQFVPPGRNLVLLTADGSALWVSRWPRYAWHAWTGAWTNTLFRREAACPMPASALIREAVAATCWKWGAPPVRPHPFVTFVDPGAVRPKRDPGYCYLMAGWERIGTTAGGLAVLGLPQAAFPIPEAPGDAQLEAALA